MQFQTQLRSSKFQGTLSEELCMWTFDTNHMRCEEATSDKGWPFDPRNCACWAMWNIKNLVCFIFLWWERLTKIKRATFQESCAYSFPATVIVLGVMPSRFFPNGLRANSVVYKKLLERVVRLWIEILSNGKLYTYQQVSAPSHRAKTTQEWMSYNLHNQVTYNLVLQNWIFWTNTYGA